MKKAKKTKQAIQYDYYVHSVSEDDTGAYEAIIPAFDNAIVFGDTLEELEQGVRFTIESEIRERRQDGKPVPQPEKKTKFNGKILIRIMPILHEKLALEAKASGKSLNKYIEEHLVRN